MNIPASTNHKPVIISDNYGKVDGRFASKTDVSALSLGLSEQDEGGRVLLPPKYGELLRNKGPVHRMSYLFIEFWIYPSSFAVP